MPDEATVDAVLEQLGRANPAVRYAAVRALERPELAQNVVPKARQLLADKDGIVRSAALWLLVEHNQGDLTLLVGLAKDPETRVRAMVARELAAHGKPAVETLLTLSSDSQLPVAIAAVRGLAKNHAQPKAAVEGLTEALKREGLDWEAVQALASYGTAAQSAVPDMIAAFPFDSDDTDFYQYDLAELITEKLGGARKEDCQRLVECLESENSNVRQLTIEVLLGLRADARPAVVALEKAMRRALAEWTREHAQQPTEWGDERRWQSQECAHAVWWATEDHERFLNLFAEVARTIDSLIEYDRPSPWQALPPAANAKLQQLLNDDSPNVRQSTAIGVLDDPNATAEMKAMAEQIVDAIEEQPEMREIDVGPHGELQRFDRVGGSVEASDDFWQVEESFRNIFDYAPRPEAAFAESLSVKWEQPQRDTLGNHCILRGQLLTTIGGGEPKPVDWFQGLTVWLARDPNHAADWSSGVQPKEALDDQVIVDWPSGQFTARFDLRQSLVARDSASTVQVGIALAEHRGGEQAEQRVVWRSSDNVLPASLAELTMPAAKQISRELQLITAANQWPWQDPDPTKVIRAVNALQRLGKDEALKLLEQYLKCLEEGDSLSDEDIVFWLTQLLFEPACLDEPMPIPGNAVWLEEGKGEERRWRFNPLESANDIPFMIGRPIGIGGMPEPPSAYSRFARHHCVLRPLPMQPTLDPLTAADAILGSQKFEETFPRGDKDAIHSDVRKRTVQLIREQAASAVVPLHRYQAHFDEKSAFTWTQLKKLFRPETIKWSPTAERFEPNRR